MGTFSLKAQISAGRRSIEECSAHGRDVDLTLDGGLKLRRRIETSIAEMNLEFRFSDAYKTQSDLTKALFGQPDSKVPGLFDTVTKANLGKLEDGGYGARLSGPFSRLRPRPRGARSEKAEPSERRRPTTTRRSRPRTTARRSARRSKSAPAAENDGAEEASEAAAEDATDESGEDE
jgi:hypothetical protein